ncbi:recombinase family protein [Oerskovia paurometabola]|uniref:recombinase family protein n=1 Tax=Oerskovia paurometabola TaxID=162170 RepID=UPI00380DA3FB
MTTATPSCLRLVPNAAPRAVLYLRQSTHREESISLELQETAGREYCTRRGYDVVAVEADPGISGRTWERPAVRRTMELIEARHADVLVVWKWSRLSRSRRDWAVAVDKIEVAGGRLESSTEPVDTTTSTGRFTRGMLAELAAFESERIGDTWRETHARRRRLGLPHNGSPRLGYTYDPASKTYSPDPETAGVVRELYARYIAGQGLGALSKWTRDLGVISPRTGKPWTHRGIAYLLDSGWSAGLMYVHDPDCTDPRPPGTCPRRVHVDGAHEAVITEDVWHAFQTARQSRTGLPPRLVNPVSPLSGVARCASCGHRMALHRQKQQTPRLRCANRECSSPVNIAYPKVEAAVREWLPSVAERVARAAQQLPADGASVAVERARHARLITEIERALTQLTIDHARRIVPSSAYSSARDALLAERQAASAALATLDRAASSHSEHAAAATDLASGWESMSSVGISLALRGLCVATVSRTPGVRGANVRVRGIWEDEATEQTDG